MSAQYYEVLVDHRVDKDLKRVPPNICKRFLESLDELGRDPVHFRIGMDIKRLKGSELFRLRIGDYRVLYSIDEERSTVKVTSIMHRSKAYRIFCNFICP